MNLIFSAILLLLPLTMSAPVAAATIQLPRTGQMVSYKAADDGALKQGTIWPTPRFTDNGDGTVSDNLTGLIWLQYASCSKWGLPKKKWNDALNEANTLASGICRLTDGSLAGDWRLPNRKELQSLSDMSQYRPALPLGHPFIDVQMDYYWSSSTNARATKDAWTIDMKGGGLEPSDKNYFSYYIWPVRDRHWTLDNLIIALGGSVNFGSRNLGEMPAREEMTFSNYGSVSQRVTGMSITGADASHFGIGIGGSTPCSSMSPVLNPGESCTIEISFSPSSAGAKRAAISVSSNGKKRAIAILGAGTATVKGVVHDLSTGDPVSGATITISGGTTTTTGADGRFLFSPSPAPGPYSVTITKSGFQSLTNQNIAISEAQGANLDMWLPTAAALALPSQQLAPASTGIAYSQRLKVLGGSLPLSFSTVSGALPPGLRLDHEAGLIDGVPTTAGSFIFGIGVTDSATSHSELIFIIDVAAPLAITTPATLPRGLLGNPFTVRLSSDGGTPPYVYSAITGSLTNNLTLSRNGIISGTPSAAGSDVFTVYLTDSAGRSSSKQFTFTAGLPLHSLAVNIAGTGSGSVNSSPSGLSCVAATCSNQFEEGTHVMLIPTPDSNSTFNGWSGACTAATGNCTVALTANNSATATFDLAPPAKIGSTGYASLQAAYDVAADGAVVQMKEGTYSGAVVANRAVRVALKGGYNAAFSSASGETVIDGRLLVRAGTLKVERVSVK